MESKKLDRLFQDKLARQEVSPSDDAWNQISSELNQEKRPVVWMRVAAAIVILAISAVVVVQLNNEPRTGVLAGINPTHPVIEEQTWDFPEIKKTEPVKVEQKATLVKRQPKQTQFAAVETRETVIEQEVLELPELTPIQSVAIIEVSEPELSEEEILEETLPQLSVQITYIASHAPEQDTTKTDDKTKVGRLIAKAREISPGEMLASIRETKNNFFNGINN